MTDKEIQECCEMKQAEVKLMAQCQVGILAHPGIVADIRRGMAVIDKEGKEVGKVAAVAVRPGSRQSICLILSHLPEKKLYQSLPSAWIDQVDGEIIHLNVLCSEIQALPEWHPA